MPPATDHALSEALARKIADRTATVAVIGLGYVGLPLILGFADAGFPVLGLDVDAEKIKKLRAGESYIKHITSDSVAAAMAKGKFRTESDLSHVADADAVIICLPTPLTKHRDPDLSYIVHTSEVIAPHLKRGQLIILESTTWPGTTREVMIPLLEKGSGLMSRQDFFAAFSPEREDPGNPNFNTHTIPKVVGGDGEDATQLADALYRGFIHKTVVVSSPDTAEAVKLTENIFRSINIALVNELKVVYDAMGIDVWEVIGGAATKPFGFMPFYPGPGLGGHCIPIDPFYLTWKAREYELNTKFIELAGEIIAGMPKYVVSKLASGLSTRFQKSLSGAKILLLGMAYKKNVDDMRETPALKIIDLLEAAGAQVSYHDDWIPVIPHTREHPEYTGRASVPLSPETLKAADAVVIVTEHDAVDYGMVSKHAKLVVDTRNAMAKQPRDNVIKA
ncbi:MAG: nucleotide sugar dehydrogenase [Rhodospirillales bacterium]|nr:nucleotide sugar dehydrogenase [Alphaproteobacteria bacterium]MCB9986271.1 nucleotide sugar dehydrogenase [Rhodospirillales bacterium]USO08620.1 MAG: nucleotide sugar dehydrogenase [Rhodospirillales bacterium]